jgi:hypothetical protein
MNTATSFLTRTFIRKWILIILAIKLVLFGYFAINFQHHWDADRIYNGVAIGAGDTGTYYEPAQDILRGEGYSSICRMPGIVPIYVPLSAIFGVQMAYVIVVILQFLCSVLSVLLLAIIAARLFGSKRAFLFTAIAFSFSTFVSIWDHYLMSDSFSTSFIIFSLFYITQFSISQKLKHLMIAGLFMAWSVFFRQIVLVAYPVAALIIFTALSINWRRAFIGCISFGLPLVLSIGIWTAYNYKKEQRFIPLVAPFTECFKVSNTSVMALAKLVISWGGDSQPWVNGTPSNWFLVDSANVKPPVSPGVYTSVYNEDSLRILKKNYRDFAFSGNPELSQAASEKVIASANRYYASYKKEHFFDFLLLNRIKLTSKFIFPKRIDNLPGPPLAKMNILQKAVKGVSLIALLGINVLGLLGLLLVLWRRHFKLLAWALVPWTFILALSSLLGFIEQRYLTPSYPFMLLFAVYFILFIGQWKTRHTETATV